MSYEYYSKWWAGTKHNLEKLIQKDAELVKMTNQRVKDRTLANQLVGGLYAKYSMLVQDLGTILDQMAQPQKRIIVRKLMDAATVRLHELNEELRTIDISEYHYIDGALIELKLIPQEVEILDPNVDGKLDYILTKNGINASTETRFDKDLNLNNLILKNKNDQHSNNKSYGGATVQDKWSEEKKKIEDF
ncbi:hypothetical protein BDFB_011658 [Asbolus verrucosus]|uniref:Uncharacterized protein n=1 Tax=Asbolus verrucosus TaxID=1661398 RepID=A0A482W9U5_ASBVE|nr:hypothetical protein BDFB_011658 [Asbolus verrucosus]